MAHHLPPDAWAVRFTLPYIELMWDLLLRHYSGELPIILYKGVLFPDYENDLQMAELFENG